MKQLIATSILAAAVVTVCSMCSTGTDNNNGRKAIFVTESSYTGDLVTPAKVFDKNVKDGIAAADALCNQAAKDMNYNGTFKALINTSLLPTHVSESVVNVLESVPYYNISAKGAIESTIAFTSVKQATTNILTQINGFNDARGIAEPKTNWVGNATNYCTDWTSAATGANGNTGAGQGSTNWATLVGTSTAPASALVACNATSRLVCVQQ